MLGRNSRAAYLRPEVKTPPPFQKPLLAPPPPPQPQQNLFLFLAPSSQTVTHPSHLHLRSAGRPTASSLLSFVSTHQSHLKASTPLFWCHILTGQPPLLSLPSASHQLLVNQALVSCFVGASPVPLSVPLGRRKKFLLKRPVERWPKRYLSCLGLELWLHHLLA